MKMKKFILLLSLIFSLSLLNSQNQYSVDTSTGDPTAQINVKLDQNGPLQPKAPVSNLLYDNGPLLNSTGTGAGGADESVLQDVSLSMGIYGWGHQITQGLWIADDFTITDPLGWDIANFVFFAYQTYSPTTSTMTAVHFLIYDGIPGDVGTNLVWGDASTDRLTSTIWSNIYRVTETSSGNTERPIMENTCDVTFHLDAGTYWVVWQTGGTLSSGPWAPPITITGQSTTGNALQSTDNQTTWNSALDSGSSTQQDFPFIIYGAAPSVPVSNWALGIGLLLISAFIVIRFRRRLA